MNTTSINLIIVIIFSLLNHFLLAVSSKFIQSKPTGSRMVTADLNIFLNKTMISASWVLTNVVIIRIIFGPMNYWLVLFCIGRIWHNLVIFEDRRFLVLVELSITLVGGAFNVSAFVQMSIIMNFEWTSNNDKVCLILSHFGILNQFLENHLTLGSVQFPPPDCCFSQLHRGIILVQLNITLQIIFQFEEILL